LEWEFQGLTPEAIEFLVALRFNNNKPFFQDNRTTYERTLKEPLQALARDLAPVMSSIDPDLDTRPARVVSRIYRDARYSRGIPYRDHLWLSWKPSGKSASQAFSFYFFAAVENCGWGLGFYDQCRDMMNAFRSRMLSDPGRFREIIAGDAVAGFRLAGDDYKRPPAAPGLPEDLTAWYVKKSFYLEKTVPHSVCFDASLTDRLIADFTGLDRFYGFVTGKGERNE